MKTSWAAAALGRGLAKLSFSKEPFDREYYLTANRDVEAAGWDPLLHYVVFGRREGRSPILQAEPAFPYVAPAGDPSIKHEPPLRFTLNDLPVRLIAFYLPQFHPIPENDRFWGKGFTEWTNTTRATPQFEGHQQPRLPGELGFYDLRLKQVQRRQIELARSYGIYGFCYHFYWFNGRRVMSRPIDRVLEDPSLDLPFCLHWANEPWTRSWDGVAEGEILLDQKHSPEDDMAFIRHVERAFRDPRYIRIDGRPLLAVYRPGLFPDARATAGRWREYCVQRGLGDPYLVVAEQPFDGAVDPAVYGFDAAVEFPPHNFPMEDVRDRVSLQPGFSGHISSYDAVVEASLARRLPDYTLFRSVMPGFDNTARRQERANIYLGATPERYRAWLEGLCRSVRATREPEERLVFVNAWNEWAEGAYLEPDQGRGYAFLNNTAKALIENMRSARLRKIVVVGHDANRAGAQILLLDAIRWLVDRTSTDVRIILGQSGPLRSSYEELADVLVLDELECRIEGMQAVRDAVVDFVGPNPDLLYVNSAASSQYLPDLEALDAPLVLHCHELSNSIERFSSNQAVSDLGRTADRIIAASEPVAENLISACGIPRQKVEVIHEFIDPARVTPTAADRSRIRSELNLLETDIAVVACGTLDWRKAPDLFLDVAETVLQAGPENVHFYWIGEPIAGQFLDLDTQTLSRGLGGRVRFLGGVENPTAYFAASDIFLLPSREDPYPLVCLEAALCGLPAVCFADAGGIPAFVGDDAGYVVAFEDVRAMASAVTALCENREDRLARAAAARRKILERHTVDATLPRIFHLLLDVAKKPPAVSVIVPNYNYGHYLDKRMDSIFRQTFQDFEVIIEDDASEDDSVRLLESYVGRPGVQITTHVSNRGVFAMWKEGLAKASARLVWIAEADDLCADDFLAVLTAALQDETVALAYCQSAVIDEDGHEVGDYFDAFPDLSKTKWRRSYVCSGEEELRAGLAIQNYILNASGVVFRKPDLKDIEDVFDGYVACGDWRLYLTLLTGGYCAYVDRKLNCHRRHDRSVIARLVRENQRQLVSEIARIHGELRAAGVVDRSQVRAMRDYAQQLWRTVNDAEDDEEFDRVYGVKQGEEIR